jgi:hypothetical protein
MCYISGMSTLSARTAIVFAAVAAVVTIVSVPGAAGADTSDVITIDGVTSPAANPGLLTIEVNSSTPITSLSAEIEDGSTQLLSLPFTDFELTGGSNTGTNLNSTWTLTSPITQTELPLGSYTVAVSAADSGGGSVLGPSTGTLNFLAQPALTFSWGKVTVSGDTETLAYSGTVSAVDPDGQSAPVNGATVSGSYTNQSSQVVPVSSVTDASGGFTGTITDPNPNISQPFVLSVPATATMAGGSEIEELFGGGAGTSIAASLGAVNRGSAATLSGTLSYQYAGVTYPAASESLTIASSEAGFTPVTVSADGSGHFTYTTTAQTGDSVWTITFAGNDYLAGTQATLPLTVNQPTSIAHFTAGLSAFGVLSLKACVSTPLATRLTYVYSASAHGPWRTLGTVAPGTDSACTGTMVGFPHRFTVPLANGYYQARFASVPGAQASASGVLHEWKHLTRITGFKVSPTSVSKGGTVTVTGRLWVKSGTWKPLAHRRVAIYFEYNNTIYVYVKEMTSNSTGRFSGRYRVEVTAPWIAQYNGDSTHFASDSAVITVRLRKAAALAANAAGAQAVPAGASTRYAADGPAALDPVPYYGLVPLSFELFGAR